MSSEYVDALYYSIVICLISSCASYASRRSGIVVSSIITGVSTLFTYGAASIGGQFFLFGLLIWPGVAWFGFLLGQQIRKRMT
jgi:hypothetical protein